MIIVGSVLLITAFLVRITLLYEAGFILLTIGWIVLVTRWIGARSATTIPTPRPWAAYQRLAAIAPDGVASSTNRATNGGDHDADVIEARP